MGKFTRIAENVFSELSLEAGVLLNNFDPTAPAAPADADIICATTGGIQITATPSFSDFGSDIDNCPNNTLDLKHIDGWECSIGFTALNVTPAIVAVALGCAKVDSTDLTKIVADSSGQMVPNTVNDKRVSDVWWVGDLTSGGCVAVKLSNALSTGGLSLKSTKNGKGQLSVTLTGHVTLANPNAVPMEFYVHEAEIP